MPRNTLLRYYIIIKLILRSCEGLTSKACLKHEDIKKFMDAVGRVTKRRHDITQPNIQPKVNISGRIFDEVLSEILELFDSSIFEINFRSVKRRYRRYDIIINIANAKSFLSIFYELIDPYKRSVIDDAIEELFRSARKEVGIGCIPWEECKND